MAGKLFSITGTLNKTVQKKYFGSEVKKLTELLFQAGKTTDLILFFFLNLC